MNETQKTDNAAALVVASNTAATLLLGAIAQGAKITDSMTKDLLPADANTVAGTLLAADRPVPKALAIRCDKKALRKQRDDRIEYYRQHTGQIHGALLDEGAFIKKMSPWSFTRNGDASRTLTIVKPHCKVIECKSTAELVSALSHSKIEKMSATDLQELQAAMNKLVQGIKVESANEAATPVESTVISTTPDVPAAAEQSAPDTPLPVTTA